LREISCSLYRTRGDLFKKKEARARLNGTSDGRRRGDHLRVPGIPGIRYGDGERCSAFVAVRFLRVVTATATTKPRNPRVLERGVFFNEHAFGKRLEYQERDALPLELRFGNVGFASDTSGGYIDNAEEGVYGGVERVRGERGDGVE
jgi:hypothetical protein